VCVLLLPPSIYDSLNNLFFQYAMRLGLARVIPIEEQKLPSGCRVQVI
jgi:hypothetical protein